MIAIFLWGEKMASNAVLLLETIKQLAKEQNASDNPVQVLFGTVKSIDPISVEVDQFGTLTSEFLVLAREVTDYDVEMTVDHMTEKMQGGGKDPSFTSHAHPYKGRKVFTVHKKLHEGEKVILLGVQGGQQFVILDRVGG